MRFKKAAGLTPSEKVLADICDRSFLSVWSYPNLFRTPAKELCDVLVVFGDNVVIFSDKSCAYPDSGDPALDWSRWYRRSIGKSAHQIRRAEQWVRNLPERVFLDAKCEQPLPIQLPPAERLRVHRICTPSGFATPPGREMRNLFPGEYCVQSSGLARFQTGFTSV